MAAGARTEDPEVVGLHPVLRGMRADEPHGAVDVLGDLRDHEPRLGTVHDAEDRVAAVEHRGQQAVLERAIERLVAGEEPARRHVEHAVAVGLGRLDHIERERRAVLAAVDDLGADVGRPVVAVGGEAREREREKDRTKGAHP